MFNLIKITILLVSLCASSNVFSKLHGSDIFEKAAPGVVVVLNKSSMASGVIISEQGHILTNWHVVTEHEVMTVSLFGTTSFEESLYKVELLKIDKIKDLALIKIIDPPNNLKVVNLSRVIPQIGDEVHAIGHPEGEIWSYTMGFISQHRQDYTWNYSDTEYFKSDVFQMQTPIYPGNSGGPLLNKYGNLVGLNTFITKDKDSINYAVTVEEIIKFLSN